MHSACYCSYLFIIFLLPFQYVLLFSWVDFSPATYGDNYVFPFYANAIGVLITVSIVLPIPIFMVIKYCRAKGSFKEVIHHMHILSCLWLYCLGILFCLLDLNSARHPTTCKNDLMKTYLLFCL